MGTPSQDLRLPPRPLTLAVLAAGAPAVETVAWVRVARWEAGGRGGEGRVGERLPAHGPRVAGRGERCQSVLLGAPAAGALVQIERGHVFVEEVKKQKKNKTLKQRDSAQRLHSAAPGEDGRGDAGGCTLAEVSEGVVALLREGDLVDGVSQVAVFQQTAGVLPGVPAILEALHPGVEPVHHVSTWHAKQTHVSAPALMCRRLLSSAATLTGDTQVSGKILQGKK